MELDKLWDHYEDIINYKDLTWEDANEARALLYLTGQIYCEKIAVEAIERRLHLLSEKFSLLEFLDVIDKESERLEELRGDELFSLLEKFYRVVKSYKNKYMGGMYCLEEEKFLKRYNETNPNKELRIGYRGNF